MVANSGLGHGTCTSAAQACVSLVLTESASFYVYPPPEVAEQPIFFVPTYQFEQFLGEINKALNVALALTARDRQRGLVVEMPEDPAYIARFAGTSISRDTSDAIKSSVTKPSTCIRNALRDQESGFYDLMIKVMSVVKDRGSSDSDAASIEKRKQEQLMKSKDRHTHLLETERLLGLRIGSHGVQEAMAQTTPQLTPVDVSRPMPYPFEGDAVFIAIDLEWWERDYRIVTEIGISTLDTADLVGVAPGKNGQHWESKIRAKHFRIYEHRNYRNSFANGNPEAFDFGKTIMIGKEDAPHMIANCFKPPYSAVNANHETLTRQRNVVLVGHDMKGDFAALVRLGYDIRNLATLHEMHVDTAALYRAFKKESSTPSLGKVVTEFDFVPWNLHNAGNDAFYTMQAMIAIALASATTGRTDSNAAKG